MAYATTNNPEKLKKFNGLRRTKEGMLYLSTIDPNSESTNIQLSNFFEPGKTDEVPKDQTDYVEERLELYNVQYFTGDNSTTTFTLNNNNIPSENAAVFVNGVRQTNITDYKIVDTGLIFTIKPANNANITIGQINKRFRNNDGDNYQQFKYSDNLTTTYLINSNGDLVKRVNQSITRTALASDDFDTFESGAAVSSSTTYQDAV